MKMINFIKTIFNRSNDPVKKCKIYKEKGCVHVDSYLCDMDTCIILNEHKFRELEQELGFSLNDRMEFYTSVKNYYNMPFN